MEAKSAGAAAREQPGTWQYEPKWDGFRCLAFKAGDAVELRAKSGKPLGRYFPEVVAMLCDSAGRRSSLSTASWSSRSMAARLSMRCRCGCIRPKAASENSPPRRRRDLSCSICWWRRMALSSLTNRFQQRRQPLEDVHALKPRSPRASSSLLPRPIWPTRRSWLRDAGHGATDGVIAKELARRYRVRRTGDDQGEAAPHR